MDLNESQEDNGTVGGFYSRELLRVIINQLSGDGCCLGPGCCCTHARTYMDLQLQSEADRYPSPFCSFLFFFCASAFLTRE